MADHYERYLSDAKFRNLVNQLTTLMRDYRWGGQFSDFGRQEDQTHAEIDLANELDWNAAVRLSEDLGCGTYLFEDDAEAAEALTGYVAIQRVAVPPPRQCKRRA